MNKKELGQFYTTHVNYILQGFDKPFGKQLIEPFVGNGDLLKWIDISECYDIDPKIENTIQRDTLMDPPDYKNKFVITNPPYLAKNKTKNKIIFEKYDVDDLYKAFLKTIIDGDVSGGILILPLNFICSLSANKIRNLFFDKYKITKLNVFEEAVFNDTDIPVCSFQFEKHDKADKMTVPFVFYPYGEVVDIVLQKEFNWMVAGHLYNTVKNDIKVSRLIKDCKPDGFITYMYLYASDSGSVDGRIRLEMKDTFYYGKISDRNFATIVVNVVLTKDEQMEICKIFNQTLEELRAKYHSLFLTNFRNSTQYYTRKRITFRLAFSLINTIIKLNLFKKGS